jgi:hypothetical protein
MKRSEAIKRVKESFPDLDKRDIKLQILLAEMHEVTDSKTAEIIFEHLTNYWSEESLLRIKVSILTLKELEKIRIALEDPYHIKMLLNEA